MKLNLQIIGTAALVWLIPFIISMPFFGRDGKLAVDIFLFKSVMIVVSCATGAGCLYFLFSRIHHRFLWHSLLISIIWLGLNYLLDIVILLPLAKQDIATWFFQTGMRYTNLVISSFLLGLILKKKVDRNV